jgi:S-adenosylmethionine:tRNA ribosyltransferase-isomerase
VSTAPKGGPSDPSHESDLFSYELPPELIAQHPVERREQSRLLMLPRQLEADAGAMPVEHHGFTDLPALLAKRFGRSCLLVANNSAVFPARLHARRETGGQVELLVLALDDELPPVLGRANKKLRDGEWLTLTHPTPDAADGAAGGRADGREVVRVKVVGPIENGRFRIDLRDLAVCDLVERYGEVPLPPYIRRGEAAGPEDRERYQTVYAGPQGSVAAPTAGLHFTQDLIAKLCAEGHDFATVTLHVGPGTFSPIRGALGDHEMEVERYEISDATAAAIGQARADGRPVVSIGTTTVRALESASDGCGGVRTGKGETRLFIKPGYQFQVIQGLVTNFHLPGSTLLALVAAFAGEERVRQAYADAVAERYRFYSYGDAMLIA